MNIIEKSKKYAILKHEETNHKYDEELPYSVHLDMVYHYGLIFIKLIDENIKDYVLASCYTHDLIEDCRETFNDVKLNTCFEVAEITFALTNEKGKNRNERANNKYYDGIKNTNGATFVKLCDRLANISYSKSKHSNMLTIYKGEYENFKSKLYSKKYEIMFNEIEKILEI